MTPTPLAGLRVVDASRVLAGPFCGQLLADLGADVLKVERPGTGDDTRGWGPPFAGDLSAYFISCNRGKRSVVLDLHDPAGNAAFHELLNSADVLIENFRTDSLPKLGLTPDQLRDRHPRLVACSVSGFGRTGPRADDPGYDFAIQALSGLMHVTGPPDGPPFKVGVAVTDVLTGLYASTAVLAAVRDRDRTGRGCHIDLALFDCALAAQVNLAQAYLTTGVPPGRQGNAHLQIVPYQLFPTADGYLVLNVGNDSQWRAFCAAAGEPELGADVRYATNRQRVQAREELVPLVGTAMRKFPTAEWERRLTAATVPHAVVRDHAGAFADPQAVARGMSAGGMVGSPVRIDGVMAMTDRPVPDLGEQTDEVLEGRGLR
jgi:crotonobetainyl-CoA:carnitine CoA-transferase CaiB-like acyl-CoA transferase